MIIEELKEFQKDLTALSKKYITLITDLDIALKIIITFPNDRPPFSYRINNLGIQQCVIMVKKIACKSLKGKGVNSGLRLIYAYSAGEEKITLIEIYHKNEKEKENRDRIQRNFKLS